MKLNDGKTEVFQVIGGGFEIHAQLTEDQLAKRFHVKVPSDSALGTWAGEQLKGPDPLLLDLDSILESEAEINTIRVRLGEIEVAVKQKKRDTFNALVKRGGYHSTVECIRFSMGGDAWYMTANTLTKYPRL